MRRRRHARQGWRERRRRRGLSGRLRRHRRRRRPAGRRERRRRALVQVERAAVAVGVAALKVDELGLEPADPVVQIAVSRRAPIVQVRTVRVAPEPRRDRVVRHPAKVGAAIDQLKVDGRVVGVGQLRPVDQPAAVEAEARGFSFGVRLVVGLVVLCRAQVLGQHPDPFRRWRGGRVPGRRGRRRRRSLHVEHLPCARNLAQRVAACEHVVCENGGWCVCF